jgi:hypothetical protein
MESDRQSKAREEHAEKLAERGEEFEGAGRLEFALACFEDAIEIDSKHAKSLEKAG